MNQEAFQSMEKGSLKKQKAFYEPQRSAIENQKEMAFDQWKKVF